MNYLWEVTLKADDCQVPRESLRYTAAKICSPYIEVKMHCQQDVVPECRAKIVVYKGLSLDYYTSSRSNTIRSSREQTR